MQYIFFNFFQRSKEMINMFYNAYPHSARNIKEEKYLVNGLMLTITNK